MAAGAWVMHDTLIEEMANGNVDFDTDTFKIILLLSTSNIATTSVVDLASVTNQVATNYGYTQNDKTIALTVAEASGVVTIDGADVSWSASGGDITARFAAIYNDTHGSDLILAHCLLDDSPADVTATDGNPLNINMNASGILVIQRA